MKAEEMRLMVGSPAPGKTQVKQGHPSPAELKMMGFGYRKGGKRG